MIPIFDELVYAERLLTTGFVKFMSRKDLTILAKFYFFKELDAEQTRKKLNAFCYRYNSEYNEVIFGKSIDKAIKDAKKSKLFIPDDVVITTGEIERIKMLHNYRIEKLLFAILVCAKYRKQTSDEWRRSKNPNYLSNKFFVNPVLSPYFSLAKVYANRQEQDVIKHDLMARGYLTSETNNPSLDGWLEVLYGESNYKSEEVFAEINSRDNILDFYPPYFICLGCGKEVDKSGNNKKYCVACASLVNKNQVRERVKKHRQSKCNDVQQICS